MSDNIEHRAFWDVRLQFPEAYKIICTNIEKEFMRIRKEQETKTFLPAIAKSNGKEIPRMSWEDELRGCRQFWKIKFISPPRQPYTFFCGNGEPKQ